MTPDHFHVANVVAALGAYVDGRDWERLEQLFAPTVQVDYTSLFGGERSTTTPTALVASWREFLPFFATTTEHMIGTPFVEIDRNCAKALAPVVACHIVANAVEASGSPDRTWLVGGRHEIRFAQYRPSAVRTRLTREPNSSTMQSVQRGRRSSWFGSRRSVSR